jgi:hypothetical protein
MLPVVSLYWTDVMPPLEIFSWDFFMFVAVLHCSSWVWSCLSFLLAVIFGLGSASAWVIADHSRNVRCSSCVLCPFECYFYPFD